jgi:hypothetical protein
MSKGRGTKAWVIRWEWSGPHAAVEEPVASVLPWRLGVAQIERIVEALYAAKWYTPDEMLGTAKRNGHKPYGATLGTISVDLQDGHGSRQIGWQGEVWCGHNPMLVARKAQVWPSETNPGEIVWEDVLSTGAKSSAHLGLSRVARRSRCSTESADDTRGRSRRTPANV